jgi:hypothetical protein
MTVTFEHILNWVTFLTAVQKLIIQPFQNFNEIGLFAVRLPPSRR